VLAQLQNRAGCLFYRRHESGARELVDTVAPAARNLPRRRETLRISLSKHTGKNALLHSLRLRILHDFWALVVWRTRLVVLQRGHARN
jgi:hypothetical protein